MARFFIGIILGLVAKFAFMLPSLSSSAARWKSRVPQEFKRLFPNAQVFGQSPELCRGTRPLGVRDIDELLLGLNVNFNSTKFSRLNYSASQEHWRQGYPSLAVAASRSKSPLLAQSLAFARMITDFADFAVILEPPVGYAAIRIKQTVMLLQIGNGPRLPAPQKITGRGDQ